MKTIKVITGVLLLFAVLSLSAFAQNDNTSQNNGQILPPFNKITVNGNLNVLLDQQDFQSVKITSVENKDKILVYVSDSTLHIVSRIYDIYFCYNI